MDAAAAKAAGASAPPPEAEAPPPRPPARPEVRRAVAKRGALKQAVRRLGGDATEADLAAKLRELRAKKETQNTAPEAAAGGAAVGPPPDPAAAPPLEPGQRPGWPPPSAVAQFEEPAKQLWQLANALLLKGSRWELRKRAPDAPDPVDVLAQATAPVAAKWAPHVATTPEAALLAALVFAFGGPTLELLKEWQERRAAAELVQRTGGDRAV